MRRVSFRGARSDTHRYTYAHRLSAHIRAALTSVCVPLLSDFVRARIRRLACSRMLVRLGRRASPLHLPARLTTASILSIRAPSAYCVRGNRISVCAQAERRIARPESRLYCTNTSARAAQDRDPDRDGGKEESSLDDAVGRFVNTRLTSEINSPSIGDCTASRSP